MNRGVTLLLALLMVSAPSVRAQTSAKVAEEEAIRRQTAAIQTRMLLQKADELTSQGNLLEASRKYEEALAMFDKTGGLGGDAQLKQIVDGLSAVNLQLAEMAHRKGNDSEATARVNRVLKLDSKNSAALEMKERHAKEVAAMAGKVASPEVRAQMPAFAKDLEKAATLVQDGKLLFQASRLDEAEEKFKQAARLDPNNAAAFYYLDLLREARYQKLAAVREVWSKESLLEVEKYWIPSTKRDSLPTPNPAARTNLVHTSPQRQKIYQKLNEIVIPEVLFDGLPLTEVVRFLSDEVKKYDPDQRGLNFIINSFADAGGGAPAVTIDPTTGAAIPVAPLEPVDLSIVSVKLNPALVNVRLADVLDAIAKVADKPIKYSVEDYAVVFTARRPEPVQLYTRVFKVNPDTFVQGLQSVTGTAFGDQISQNQGGQGGGGQGGGGQGGGRGGGGQGGDQQGGQSTFVIPRVALAQGAFLGGDQGGGGGGGGGGQGGQNGQGGAGIAFVTLTNRTEQINVLVREFFVSAGVNLAPPANVFFNDRNGSLLVRATLADLDIVEQAMQVLNEAPPQITIDVKFAEVSQEDIKGVGFDWFLGNFRFGNSGVVGSGGTQPSLNGLGPSGLPNTFPGVPGSAGQQIGNTIFPAAASTLIPNRPGDGLVSSGLRNLAGNGGNIPEVATITGILTDPQFRVVIRAMEQRGGVDLLSAPRVTTLSGRQTQIAIVDLVTVVAGVNLNQQAGGGGGQIGGVGGIGNQTGVIGTTANYNTASLPFGPVLDVVPYVAADGYTIHMTIIPTLTEFLGYDDPGAFVPTAQGAAGNNIGTPLTAQLPLPRLRSRVLATSATVWDGQTIVLGGLITEDVQKFKDKVPVLGDLPVLGRMFRSESRFARKKNLVIFVSPTIIDPAGNRVHTDDELPFAKSAIPPQPATQN